MRLGMQETRQITSLHNPRIKHVVKLKKRSVRDAMGLLVVEGYRELARALESYWRPQTLFTCPALYLGKNEEQVVQKAAEKGAEVFVCTESVFRKVAYRERPEGLLAVGPWQPRKLADLSLPPVPLLLVAEGIEKPGNLGTMLRSADAAGADAVIVCDRKTDLRNPNVVRASIGTIFSVPVVEADSPDALSWLRKNRLRIVAATPHATTLYTEADLAEPTAIVVGAEQYGLSACWMDEADARVSIPMRGRSDSLNVATATTILLYEALRQRGGRAD